MPATPLNLFVQVHGMNPSHHWVKHDEEFAKFRKRLTTATGKPIDQHHLDLIWGQEDKPPPHPPVDDDEFLRPGKESTRDRVRFETLKDGPNEHLLPWP